MFEVVSRIFYAVKMAWRYRARLKRYQKDPNLQIENVLQLDPKRLKFEGIAVLVLDLDGVLVAYGEETLDPQISKWLNSCLDTFGLGQVFILSNKPTQARAQLFMALGIDFIQVLRKKPYPDGLIKILAQTKTAASTLLLIDDRLLTGILAAEIAGVKARWITKPYVNLKIRPWSECYFIALRAIERSLF